MNMLLVNLRMLEQTSGGSSKRKLLVEDYSNWGCVLFVFFFVCVCVRKGEPRIHQFPN
jgi:hypothetical protein